MPVIADIEKQCFSEPWTIGMLSGELENPHAVWRVAMQGDTICAYGGMHFIEGTGYITNIAVRDKFRRSGLASLIIKELTQYCLEHNGSELTLEVRPSNTSAVSLYRKHGFAKAGLRRNYYANPVEDALIMTSPL